MPHCNIFHTKILKKFYGIYFAELVASKARMSAIRLKVEMSTFYELPANKSHIPQNNRECGLFFPQTPLTLAFPTLVPYSVEQQPVAVVGHKQWRSSRSGGPVVGHPVAVVGTGVRATNHERASPQHGPTPDQGHRH